MKMIDYLVRPISKTEFKKKHWPRKALVSHGPVGRFKDLLKIPELQSVRALARVFGEPVPAWAPKGSNAPSLEVEPKQISLFYESGYTIYFLFVDRWVPALREFTETLEKELGLHP